VELRALDVEKRHLWLSSYVGAGSCFMYDENRALFCQRNGNDCIRVYACVRVGDTWAKDCGIDWNDHSAARARIEEEYFGDCGEDLRRVIADCFDGLVAPRPLYMLPVGLRWDPLPGVTLLGDSAHIMTPFAGEGANVAMRDAVGLADSVVKGINTSDLAAALKEYEADMFERGRASAQKTFDAMKICFSAGGGEIMMKIRQGRGAAAGEPGSRDEMLKKMQDMRAAAESAGERE
jgi:2-polyprenyl-6-methoxyphenol hydroxylase-like FAD-dependent oxidoreductase